VELALLVQPEPRGGTQFCLECGELRIDALGGFGQILVGIAGFG
jgi:hypothetical protein